MTHLAGVASSCHSQVAIWAVVHVGRLPATRAEQLQVQRALLLPVPRSVPQQVEASPAQCAAMGSQRRRVGALQLYNNLASYSRDEDKGIRAHLWIIYSVTLAPHALMRTDRRSACSLYTGPSGAGAGTTTIRLIHRRSPYTGPSGAGAGRSTIRRSLYTGPFGAGAVRSTIRSRILFTCPWLVGIVMARYLGNRGVSTPRRAADLEIGDPAY